MAPSGLSTSRSDGRLSPLAWDLLRGAPALTATGLSPASLIQHDPPCLRTVNLSGRNMLPFYRASGPIPESPVFKGTRCLTGANLQFARQIG